jgi:O-antigen ligase
MYASRHFYVVGLFTAIFAATTLVYGGNFPLAQAVVPALLSIFAAVGLLALPVPQAERSSRRWLGAGLLLPIVAILMWPVIQLTTGWGGQAAPWPSVSINPGATLAQVTLAAGYALAALVLFRLGQAGKAGLVVKAATLVITAATLYGLVVYAMGNKVVFLLPKTSYADSLSGTFINRNSFATLLGLGVLGNLAVMLQRVGEISRRLAWKQRLRAFWWLVVRPGWPWLVAALVCMVALLLTNSRAGLAVCAVGLLAFLGGLASVRAAVRWPLLGFLAVMAVAGLLLLGAMGQVLGSRLGQLGQDLDIRGNITGLAGDVLLQSPWLGSGFGTFESIFHLARNASLVGWGVVDHAHNTYMELAVELGLPATAVLMLALFTLLALCLNGMAVRRRAVVWPSLGVAAIVLLGSHALFDFSLSIPAVALVALAFVMPAAGASLVPPKTEDTAPTPPRNRLRLAAGLGLCALVLVMAGWQAAAGVYRYRATPVVNAQLSGKKVPAAKLYKAEELLRTCLAIAPWHAGCAADAGAVGIGLSATHSLSGEGRPLALVYLNTAQQNFKQALSYNPADPVSWFQLAQIESFLGGPQAALPALANSVVMGPAEGNLSFLRIPVMLRLMAQAQPEDQALFAANMDMVWNARPWRVWGTVRGFPELVETLRRVLAANPQNAETWQKITGTPLFKPQPLGAGRQSR